MIRRPEKLGSELQLTSLDDVDAALHELGWCQQRTAEVDASTQAAVARLKVEANDRLKVEIDGEETAIADRSKALQAALVDWCGRHLAFHQQERDCRQLTLTHGVIGSRSLPDAVECDDKAVLAAVKKRAGLVDLMAKWLETALGAITLGGVITLKPEVSRTAAKAAWARGANAQKTLKSLGVEVKTNRASWVIEPAAVEVAAPAG